MRLAYKDFVLEINVKEAVLIILLFVLIAIAYIFGRYEGVYLITKIKEMCPRMFLNVSLNIT
jgi:hypothetical protein